MPDFDIYAVFVPALAVPACIALAISQLLGRLLANLGLYRLVLHRPIFNLALHVAILGMSVILYNRYLQ